jgi:hypothetical protein
MELQYRWVHRPRCSFNGAKSRTPRVLRQTPIDAFQQISKLRRRDRHCAIRAVALSAIRAVALSGRWPDEASALQPLRKQAHALTNVPQHLDQPARANNIQHTDRNLSSSNTDGIHSMASGCAYLGDPRVGEARQLMSRFVQDYHAKCRRGCAKRACVRRCRWDRLRSQSMR